MKTIQEYAYELEKEIMDYIGFVIPYDNTILTKQNGWSCRGTSLHIPESDTNKLSNDKARIDYSIAHECEHLVQRFIFDARINPATITQKEYQDKLNAFFQTDDIIVTKDMFERFKSHIQNNKFFMEIMDVMRFDDAYYVPYDDVKTKFAEVINKHKKDVDAIYFGNTNEVDANLFAARYVTEKYIRENQPIKYMIALKEEINGQISKIKNVTERTKTQFATQLKIAKLKYKINDIIQSFTNEDKIKLKEIEQESKLKGWSRYKNHDFQKAFQLINETTRTIDNVINEFENKCLEGAIRNWKQDKRVAFVNGYIPTDNSYSTREYKESGILEILNGLNSATSNPNYKSITVDVQSKKIYQSTKERIGELNLGNDVLATNSSSMPKERKQPKIEIDLKNEDRF